MNWAANIYKEIICLFIGAAMVATFYHTGERKAVPRPFLVPPADLQYFTFGYRENIVDSLWLRLIQDLDHCDTHLTTEDPQPGAQPTCEVDRGWTFNMVNTITLMAPKFRTAYVYGAIVLSVLLNDKEGARIIFDRAVENFPTDWKLQYNAAYHYNFELNQPEQAARLLVLAGKNGAPQWVYAFAARLYSKDGRTEFAKSVLENLLRDPNLDERYVPRIRQRLDEINGQISAESDKAADKR